MKMAVFILDVFFFFLIFELGEKNQALPCVK